MEQNWSLAEAIEHFKGQGAPQNQEALVSLLREVQSENRGIIPSHLLSEIADAYGIKESFLLAVIKRIKSLHTEEAPHRLEICNGPNCSKRGAEQLSEFIEKDYNVKSGSINKTGGFCYAKSACMKNCANGPNAKWDGHVYSGVSKQILRSIIESGDKKQYEK